MTTLTFDGPHHGDALAPAAASSAPTATVRGPLAWRASLLGGLGRRRQRQALAGLDARLLDDIGISAAAARIEVAKPFWK